MKKKEFKKMMKKENKDFKNFSVYGGIIIILLMLVLLLNIGLHIKEIISLKLFVINALLAAIIVIPVIIIDAKNDYEINKMYKYYIKENKILEYNDKSKYLKILLIISIVVVVIISAITTKYILSEENQSMKEIESALEITTNNGNVIQTQYEKFGGFSLKIPTDFGIMSEEAINAKYPNGNPPSLVYTNERGTVNIALVMNDVAMGNSQIEEYTKTMETLYKQYANNMEINFFERNNHKIGDLKFISPASDTDIYNHIIAFSIDGYLRLVNFNCTKELSEDWEEIGDFIINSIKFE